MKKLTKSIFIVFIIIFCCHTLSSCQIKENIDKDNLNTIRVTIENVDNKDSGILYGYETGEFYHKYFLAFGKLDISSIKIGDVLTIEYKEISYKYKPSTIIVDSYSK